ncbi:PH domain-containing protein [Streptomyces sp. SAS_270]|uniref:PH domain-containing protein n=1 Tax=Streptomyces sp. SAS_270 TaxID=3412748 RepID=UPI00403D4E42
MAHTDARLGMWRDKTLFWGCVALAWAALCGELAWEASGREYWRIYPFLMMAVMGLVPVWRLALVTTVRANAEGLLVRNRFRTWHIEWRDIERFTWEWGEGPRLELHDGSRVRLDAYAGWPAGSRKQQVIETIEWGRRRGSASGTPNTSSQAAWGAAEGILVVSIIATFAILLTAP